MKLGSLNPSRVLGVPSLYRLLGTMFGRTRQWQIFARDYVGAQPGGRILDVGCGPADVHLLTHHCRYSRCTLGHKLTC